MKWFSSVDNILYQEWVAVLHGAILAQLSSCTGWGQHMMRLQDAAAAAAWAYSHCVLTKDRHIFDSEFQSKLELILMTGCEISFKSQTLK